MQNKLQRIKGFSQIEVLIAVIVFSIGILAVIAALIYSARSSQTSQQHTTALELSQQYIELIKTRNLVPWDKSLGDDYYDCEDEPPKPKKDFLFCSGVLDAPDAWHQINSPPFNSEEFIKPEYDQFQRNIHVKRMSQDVNLDQYSMAEITINIRWTNPGGAGKRTISMYAIHVQP